MKQAKDLSCGEMIALLESIQAFLYLDTNAQGHDYWNPEKSWSGDEFDFIARALRQYGLVPTECTLLNQPSAAERYVLYDLKKGELAGNRIFADPGLAQDCASELNGAIVAPIILPQPVTPEPAKEPEPCECQFRGDFCSGVPGILAMVENCRVVLGAKIERCDQCQRYASDQAAFERLVELGMADPRIPTKAREAPPG